MQPQLDCFFNISVIQSNCVYVLQCASACLCDDDKQTQMQSLVVLFS